MAGWRSLALAAAGNWAEHRTVCAELLEKHSGIQNFDLANNVAWFCVRFPDAVSDIKRPLDLAEKSVALKPNWQPSLNTLGAALYRAGRYEDSITILNESMKAHDEGGTAADWLFLAMAHCRLGHMDEAKKWLTKSQQWIDHPPWPTNNAKQEIQGSVADGVSAVAVGPAPAPVGPIPPFPLPWDRRLELKLIRAEAEALLKER